MLQMPNNSIAMQPQQSMNETVLALTPPLSAMNTNTSSTLPGPFEQNQSKESKKRMDHEQPQN